MNKVYNIRLLDPSEFHLVKELAESTNSLMRNKNYKEITIVDHAVYSGAFDENGMLIASLAVFRWGIVPYYTIAQYYSKPGEMSVFSWKNNPAVAMAEFLIDIMEKENRFTWYYSRSIEEWPKKLRIKGNDFFSVSEKCKQYNRYIEEIIPKNTKSKHEAHVRQLPEVTWPHDLIVIKCCLKNKFRPFEYKLEEEYNEG
jgi:hypothetical protein